jgi:hypothetical protein
MNNLLQDIKIDKVIDPDALDIAWIEQSDLYYKYSEAYNSALEKKNELKLEIERYKENVDIIKAELDLMIRKAPEEFNLTGKVTEGAISSTILTHKDYQSAVEEYYGIRKDFNEAQHEANQLYSCVATMEQRKTALENLVRLLNQQYFSTPDEPRDLAHEYHKKLYETKKGARDKIRDRRKKK